MPDLTVRLEKTVIGDDREVALYQITLTSPRGMWSLEPTTSLETIRATLQAARAVLAMIGIAELDMTVFAALTGPATAFPEREVGQVETTITLPGPDTPASSA